SDVMRPPESARQMMRSFRSPMAIVLPALVAAALSPQSIAAADRITFDTEVMAVLSKAGCNLGTCHGNANGKGGFKLSLRGDDPAADYLALLRQVDQRRV